MTTYLIHKCCLCCATFATTDRKITHACKAPNELEAQGEADLIGTIVAAHDLTEPTALYHALERLRFGEHVAATPILPAGTTPGAEQAHE